jgi:hypothetical protein
MHTSDMSNPPLPHLRLSYFFHAPLAPTSAQKLPQRGLMPLLPCTNFPSYNSTHAHTYTHTYPLVIPCISCLMNKDKDKDKDCHLLPTCTPETAEPAPTPDASQASPRALCPVPACPRLPQLHLTRRLASRCKESSDVPTSLLCKAVPCSRNMGAPPSS